jgi:hypothetical protein
MFLVTRPHWPPSTMQRFLRGWRWLVLAGLIQPVAMEAYNVADWYWADPLFVRLVTLAGPLVTIGALAVALGGRPHLDDDLNVVVDAPPEQWLLVPAVLLFWVPWALVGIEHNWSYRLAFLGLQLIMVMLWWRTGARSAWMLETWAKRVGLAMAALGLAVCVLCQFVLAETPFLGVMAAYDPARETASAEVRAGMAATVWLMPIASAAVILVLTGFDCARRARLRHA